MFYHLLVLCSMLIIWTLCLNKVNIKIIRRVLNFSNFKVNSSIELYEWIKRMSKHSLKIGKPLTFRIGFFKLYAVTEPDDCLTIMNTCLKKHYVSDFAKPFLGNGLVTADVQMWMRNRKLLNPIFNQQFLDEFIGVFNAQAQRLVDQFEIEVGKPFDQEHLLRINNLETICSTSLGIDVSEHSKTLTEFLPQLPKLMKYMKNRIQKFWLHSDFIYNMTRDKKEFDEEAKRLKAFSKAIIEKKKIEKKNSGNIKENMKTFLDLLLNRANDTGCFTDDQIQEETDTMIAAGHDTSAVLLTFVLALLGSHADVQEKAYAEVVNITGHVNKNIDKDDLSKLVYIEAILKETLRLYPIVPVLARRIHQEVELKTCKIEANSDCFVLAYGLHRHSIWGADADQFRPERWFDKSTLPDPKYFAGFGMGRRACIGKSYAMMSMKITLAYVLRRYKISSDISKMVVKLHALSRPASGYHISLRVRNTENIIQ